MTGTVLVLGVANKRSIAWSCVKHFANCNFRVAFTYQNDRFVKTVKDLIASEGLDDTKVKAIPCDVESELSSLFKDRLSATFGDDNLRLDAIVHSVAYAEPSSMKDGSLLRTSRQAFLQAHEISAYSFLETAQCSLPLMKEGSSLTALSYLGAVQAVANYNVMGPAKASLESLVRGLALELPNQRVNAVSAGPINTLAARGIKGFSRIRADVEERAPLRRNVTAEEVASTIGYVATMATGMTGQTVYVDAGYSAVAGPGMDDL